MKGRHLLAALGAVAAFAPAAARASGPSEEAFFDIVLKGLNLLLVVGAIVWFGGASIKGFFRDRRNTISTDLDAAAKLLGETEKKYAEWERRVAGLDAELAGIREEARQRADAERDRILAEAEVAAERLRRDAAAALEQETRRARAELRAEAAELAVSLAGKLLRDGVSAADGDRMIDEFVSKLEQGAPRGASAREGASRA